MGWEYLFLKFLNKSMQRESVLEGRNIFQKFHSPPLESTGVPLMKLFGF